MARVVTQLKWNCNKLYTWTLWAACITFVKKAKQSILLVFSGLVFEVIYSLPEESDTEQATVVVFEQQPGGKDTVWQINTRTGAQNMLYVCAEAHLSRLGLKLNCTAH